MYAIKLGADPEVFLRDQQGAYVSAHDLIPGSKFSPHPVPFGALQPDGVAAEFNIHPAETAEEFTTNIENVLRALTEQVKSIRPDLVVAFTPTATFTEEYFDSLPDDAKALGCTPDFNAYTRSANEPPETFEPFRTGSGHIHIGWGEGYTRADLEHIDLCIDMVKQLDAVLYPASLLWDNDTKRRTLYGKIGCFRPCSYGVEYRPLSNAYIGSKKIQTYVFDTARRLADLLLNKGVRVFDDSNVIEMVDMIIQGVQPDESSVREYLQYIEETYDVPAFG